MNIKYLKKVKKLTEIFKRQKLKVVIEQSKILDFETFLNNNLFTS